MKALESDREHKLSTIKQSGFLVLDACLRHHLWAMSFLYRLIIVSGGITLVQH